MCLEKHCPLNDVFQVRRFAISETDCVCITAFTDIKVPVGIGGTAISPIFTATPHLHNNANVRVD